MCHRVYCVLISLLVAVTASALAAQPVHAAKPAGPGAPEQIPPETGNTGNGCTLAPNQSRSATRITGASTLKLDDGSELRLSGIILPGAIDANDELRSWPPAITAARQLKGAVVGKTIEFVETGKVRDRYNRRLAQVYVTINAQSIWLQAYMVGLGHARVHVGEMTRACALKLLRLEARAREKKLGIWANAAYRLRSAENERELLRYRSTFQIIEGRVLSVSKRHSRTFINFGRNVRRDFTIGVSNRLARQIAQTGPDLVKLEGQRVRIRGWISWRGGPYIEIRSPEQLTLVPQKPVAAARSSRIPTASPQQDPETKRHPAPGKPDAIDL